ncbi:hypothetical protein BRE01_31240 [Brevibacillus reuszeri]|uniref:Uncharacterized protein n=1 Tax=Brevibacillus reuszeri TaxID=54915 RepID=A0A0K9YYN2_9BACL|nr:hypothetical protein [Brevibacillus reuszeri]KNB73742.1 hypothetical protein ADS79_07330 [Brevibacillus reuszeri]MED1858446.1 hypothetical protein [Brevibacillus reuszeri]GED69422.1 hypothetical protein BRE01_31240 [Brevibacillus reuszeri]
MTNILDLSLRTQISETEAVIEKISSGLSAHLPDYLVQFQVGSLQDRLADLRSQLDEAEAVEDREEIELTFHPPGLPSGQIPVRTLTIVLGGLQTIVDSISNTLYNQPSEQGRIPADLLERNSLIFKEARAGSFKAILDLPHTEQNLVDDPMQTETMEHLFSLLDSSDNVDMLVDKISDLGLRTLKHYTEWTKNLKELGTTVDVDWRSSIKGSSRVSISPEKADRVLEVLTNTTDTKQTDEEVLGRLTGANVRTKTFEICTPDGLKISGRIAADILSSVPQYLDKKCKAQLFKVQTINRSSGRERVNWTLKGLEPHEY